MIQSRSDKITQATVQYLEKNLMSPFYVHDYSTKQYLELLNSLFELFTESTVLSHTLAIEKGFKLFFLKSDQEIEVKLNAYSIKLSKLFKKGINVALDKALFNLNQKLHLLKKDINQFKVHSYLHQFPQDKVVELFNIFDNLELSNDDIRSYIREDLEGILQLHKRDITLFLSKKMYVRNFVSPSSKTDGSELRFNGFDPEKLISLYEENFYDDFSDELLDMIPELENSALNFSRLDNATFHRLLPDTFRSFLDISMLPYIEGFDDETSLALNGYILRLHFDKMLAKFAEILMNKVLQRDKQADLFLKYYNGETILNEKGQKIKKSSIIDANKNIWNYSAIFSILTQYTLAQKNILTHKQGLLEKEDLYHKLETELNNIQVQKNSEVAKLDILKERLVHLRLEKKSLTYKCEKNSDKDLKSELRHCTAELRKKEDEFDILNDSVNNLILKYENHQIETNNRKQHYTKAKTTTKIVETNFKDLQQSYKLIKTALAKVITGR